MAYTTINKSGDYFNTKLYTGNATDNHAITGVGFQPDWTWIKNRQSTNDNVLYDAVRTAGKELESNTTDAERTATDVLKSFNSDGFTLGTSGRVNASNTYASWNWKANGAGSANTEGSINSIATSANATSGFSIVKYTGNGSTNQTIGHGLGTVPDFVIVKQTNTTRNWPTYSRAMGNGVTFLDITDAFATSGYTNYFYPAGMTTTTFGISDNGNINESGGTYIAYVFSSRTGYSQFGKYTGNGNADGTFVYTGFKPAFVMLKNTTDASDWNMKDSKRPGYNQVNDILYPNLNNAEEHGGDIDIVSNGFKVRTTAANTNNNGSTYIYMAFAEAPLVGSNGVTAKAR